MRPTTTAKTCVIPRSLPPGSSARPPRPLGQRWITTTTMMYFLIWLAKWAPSQSWVTETAPYNFYLGGEMERGGSNSMLRRSNLFKACVHSRTKEQPGKQKVAHRKPTINNHRPQLKPIGKPLQIHGHRKKNSTRLAKTQDWIISNL